MLRHGDGAALLVGGDAGGVRVEHGQHGMLRENLTPAADSQGFALDRIVSTTIPAAPPIAATSAGKGREGDAGQPHDETGTSRIGSVGKGAPQLIESDGGDEVGVGSEALGL